MLLSCYSCIAAPRNGGAAIRVRFCLRSADPMLMDAEFATADRRNAAGGVWQAGRPPAPATAECLGQPALRHFACCLVGPASLSLHVLFGMSKKLDTASGLHPSNRADRRCPCDKMAHVSLHGSRWQRLQRCPSPGYSTVRTGALFEAWAVLGRQGCGRQPCRSEQRVRVAEPAARACAARVEPAGALRSPDRAAAHVQRRWCAPSCFLSLTERQLCVMVLKCLFFLMSSCGDAGIQAEMWEVERRQQRSVRPSAEGRARYDLLRCQHHRFWQPLPRVRPPSH